MKNPFGKEEFQNRVTLIAKRSSRVQKAKLFRFFREETISGTSGISSDVRGSLRCRTYHAMRHRGRRRAAPEKDGSRSMRRFLFGVLVGVLLTLFFQARGAQILRAVGIDPKGFSQRVEGIQRKFLGAIETTEEAGGKAMRAGEKMHEKLER